MSTIAYKVFTSTLCSPLQKGDPVWDGTLPFTLPEVEVDESEESCGAGWNACLLQEDAIKIAGLWRDGYPSRLFRVETESPVYERKDKVRASTWTIIEEITDLRPAIERFSEQFDCPGVVKEQLAWREAFGRPSRDRGLIEEGLRSALNARGLTDWTLQEFDSAKDTWNTMNARASWDAWDVWVARNTVSSGVAWETMNAMNTKVAWSAKVAWNAWASKDARNALMVYVAGAKGWTKQAPDLLTVGLRDAYRNGLGLAIPTGPKELGWSMES